MESYGYVAIDNTGKEKKGSMEAESPDKVASALKSEGLIPVEIKQQSALNKDISFNFGGKPTPRDYAVFCRQFESMLTAGVTVVEALNMLSEQTENKKLAAALKEVQISVEKGETLSSSMREQKIFPDLLMSMVAAGEASGSLETSFSRMAIQFEKDSKTKALIKKAMIYPIVVAVVALVVVMLVVVIPSYTSMFADLGTELPAITQLVIKMSDFIISKWPILVVIIIAVTIAIRWFVGTDYGNHLIGKIGLKVPLFGDLTIKSSSARFARTLSTLLAAGISLVDAVDIVAEIMDNVILKEAMKDCKEQIIQGVPLSQPLERCGLFPPMVYHMTKIGEESGDIEGLLEKLADYYEEEVEMATQSLMAAMEPMIIIVLAGVVGFLIASVMAPMLTMYSALDSM